MTEISIENLMSHYPSLEELESKIKRNPEFHPRNNFLICRSRQKEYGHQFPSIKYFRKSCIQSLTNIIIVILIMLRGSVLYRAKFSGRRHSFCDKTDKI